MNKAILIGNLGKDPEVRFSGAGNAVCKFPLATSSAYTKDGEKVEETTWHNIVVFGPQGETCGKYITKGRQVCVEGEIRNRSYEKDGETKYITEVVANRVEFLGSGAGQ